MTKKKKQSTPIQKHQMMTRLKKKQATTKPIAKKTKSSKQARKDDDDTRFNKLKQLIGEFLGSRNQQTGEEFRQQTEIQRNKEEAQQRAQTLEHQNYDDFREFERRLPPLPDETLPDEEEEEQPKQPTPVTNEQNPAKEELHR